MSKTDVVETEGVVVEVAAEGVDATHVVECITITLGAEGVVVA